jgi:iron complex outermembrane recepter protein
MKTNKYLFPVLGMTYVLSASAIAEELETITITGNQETEGLRLEKNHSTASRLGLEIIDTPASIEVITKEDIAIKGDDSTLSAITRATGIASSASPGNGGTSVSARGFNGHSSVVQLYDGTQMYVGAGTRTFPADTWNLEKVEVLRGPGSVTNGVGAIGATINYVPKKARFGSVESEIDVSVDTFKLKRLGLGSSGSLSENVAYRIDVLNHQSDGYFDNGEEDKQAFAGALLFTPREDLDINFSIDYSDIEPATYWGTPLVNGEIPDSIRENNYNVEDGIVEYVDLWPRLDIEWRPNENVTFRSNTYYLKADRQWRNVESYAYDSVTNLVDRSFYLEILHELDQLGNRSDATFDFDMGGLKHLMNVGFEVNRIDFTHFNNSNYAGSSNVTLNNPVAGTWAQGALVETVKDYSTDTMQYAVFLEDRIEFNEQWSLVAGYRWDEYDYERQNFAHVNNSNSPDESFSNDLSGSSWRLGTVFKPTYNTSFYAQYSKALDPVQDIITSRTQNLKLSEGQQIEIGIKQSLLDNRLQYSVALYDIEKENLLSQNQPGGNQVQIGQQSSQGIEFDLFARPADTFDIEFNIALIDSVYDQFIDGPDDFSGNTPKNIPEMTSNLWMNWRFAESWSLGGGARYVDTRYVDDANDNATELPDYTVYDMSLNWQAAKDLHFYLRGKNLTDEADYALSSGNSGKQWVLGEGRSFELGLNYKIR